MRQAALGHVPPTGHGLAVVIHRGLAAWMAVSTALHVVSDTCAAGGTTAVTRSAVSDLVRAVTSLALGAVCAGVKPDE